MKGFKNEERSGARQYSIRCFRIMSPALLCRVKMLLVDGAHVFCVCSLPAIVCKAPDVGRQVTGDSDALERATSCLQHRMI